MAGSSGVGASGMKLKKSAETVGASFAIILASTTLRLPSLVIRYCVPAGSFTMLLIFTVAAAVAIASPSIEPVDLVNHLVKSMSAAVASSMS